MATEVFAAAAEGDVVRLRQFLADGYDVNFERKGKSALSNAVIFKRADAVRFLLTNGANPAIAAYDEYVVGFDTPRPLIEYARKSSSPEIAAMLQGAMDARRAPPRAVPGAGPGSAPAPVKVATPAPAAATGRGSARWEAPGVSAPGQAVLISTNGGLDWRPGKVLKVGGGETERQYLVVDGNEQNHFLDWTRVTTLERQPQWTGYFVGAWSLSTGMSSVLRTDGRDIYRVTEGGMKLPPLQIGAGGDYSWVLSDGRRLKGRWQPRKDMPGLVLLNGDKGLDWILYNSTSRSALDVSGADEVRLTNPAAAGSIGSRLGK